MQVRTIMIILVAIQLALSLTALTHNLIQQRTLLNYHHFALPSSPYLTTKYQNNQSLIFCLQFGWQLAVIFTQILILALIICVKSCSLNERGQIVKQQYWLQVGFSLGSVGVMGQTVLVGYTTAIIVEIGYEDGGCVGDMAIAVLQGVTLALQLTTIPILTYTFPSLQKTNETLQVQQPQTIQPDAEVPPTCHHQLQQQDCSNRKSRQSFPIPTPTINIFKPNYNQHTSPMGQHFSNLSQIIEPHPYGHIKQPLLQLPSLPVKDDHTIPIPSSNHSGRPKVQVPRLKLEEMRRKENEKKDPLFLLANLEISVIRSHKHSKSPSEISHQSHQSPHPTPKKQNFSPNRK